MKIINFKFFVLFHYFLILSKSNYIVIPLKKYFHFYEDENSISKIDSNLYYTELSIGEPSQNIIFFINATSESNMGIYNKYCDSKFYLDNPKINKKYNYQNSTTFYQISEGNMELGVKDLLIKDQISFYSNFELTEEIKVKNMSIIYNPNNEEYILDDVGMDFIIDKEKRATCGYIGLRLEMNYQNFKNNFLEQLKEKGIISKTIFTFIEVNKNNIKYKNNKIEYLLVIGEEIYDIFRLDNINKYINEKYQKEKYIEKTKINDYIPDEYYFRWQLKLNNIYFNIDINNITSMKTINNIFIDNNYGAIVGTKEYRDSIKEIFFNAYINKTKCFEKNIKSYEIGFFYYIVCDNDININNFPTLYLKSNNLQYVYELTKDELFLKDNNKIYFLIIFEFSRTNTWVIGKPFLEKYLLSYNYDARSISFYNENLLDNSHNNNNKKYIILIVVIILSLIALVLGFLIGRYFYNKRKNKKALELDESLRNEFSNEEL